MTEAVQNIDVTSLVAERDRVDTERIAAAASRMDRILTGPAGSTEGPFMLALRAEIVTLLEGPLTVRAIHRIGHLARSATMIAAPAMAGGGGLVSSGVLYPNSFGMGEYSSDVGTNIVLPGSIARENFGANFMKELVALATHYLESQSENNAEERQLRMLGAIETAERLGLKEVAASLREQITEKARNLLPQSEEAAQ